MSEQEFAAALAAFGEQLKDPRWRLWNLYKIVDKHGRLIDFVPNEEQAAFINGMHWRNLILKARQLGMTTLCCLLYLDDCIFNPNINAAIIAHKVDDAGEIFRTKVKLPYDTLPDVIKAMSPLRANNESTLEFVNGSQIRVTTSTRSGTVQWLHISEYGKICAQFPQRAREIRSGALASAELGCITIESTAEGEQGDFFDKAQMAQRVAESGRMLTRQDYKFFFFPWVGRPEYRLPQPIAGEDPEDTRYFNRLEVEVGRQITQPERNWWLAKQIDLGADMKREFPATPREAFEAAIEGAYFAEQLAYLMRHQRIGSFPIDPARKVHTSWDIGRNDMTSIWFWQDINGLAQFVHYYENSGEWVKFYLDYIDDWSKKHGVMMGTHYMPHDGDRKSFWTPGGSVDVMSGLDFHPAIVSRGKNKIEIINAARRKMAMCAFDENGCKIGIGHLRRYRKAIDEKLGVWKNEPLHDEASHAADAYMTFTQSQHMATPEDMAPRGVDRYRRQQHTRPKGSAMSA